METKFSLLDQKRQPTLPLKAIQDGPGSPVYPDEATCPSKS